MNTSRREFLKIAGASVLGLIAVSADPLKILEAAEISNTKIEEVTEKETIEILKTNFSVKDTSKDCFNNRYLTYSTNPSRNLNLNNRYSTYRVKDEVGYFPIYGDDLVTAQSVNYSTITVDSEEVINRLNYELIKYRSRNKSIKNIVLNHFHFNALYNYGVSFTIVAKDNILLFQDIPIIESFILPTDRSPMVV